MAICFLTQQFLPSLSAVFNQTLSGHTRVLSNRRRQSDKNEKKIHLSDEFSAKLASSSIQYLVNNSIISPTLVSKLTQFDLIPVKTRVKQQPQKLPWMISHTSDWSFNLNRNPPLNHISNSCLLSHSKVLFNYQRFSHLCLSARTFKTRTNASVGLGAEPSRLNAAEDALQHLDSKAPQPEKPISCTNEAQNELLKFLNCESLTKDEVQKLKASYAEGFLAGHTKKERPFLKWLRIIKDTMVTLFIFCFSILALTAILGDLSVGELHHLYLIILFTYFN